MTPDLPRAAVNRSGPTPAPILAPTPTPAMGAEQEAVKPTPSPPPGNRPPNVDILIEGPSSCHPRRPPQRPVEPCTVRLRAEARDADGDSISFRWSGCASGRDTTAACVVDAPGAHEARVEVEDARGGASAASVVVRGTNQAPTASLNGPTPPYVSGRMVSIYGSIHDPDDGAVCGREWCERIEATGACGPKAFLECTCLGDLYAEVTPHSAGTCIVTVTVKDDWGARGQSSIRLTVSAP